jgi:hypothetical protein
MSVVYTTDTFAGSEGRVFFHYWKPATGEVKAVVVFVHGYVCSFLEVS